MIHVSFELKRGKKAPPPNSIEYFTKQKLLDHKTLGKHAKLRAHEHENKSNDTASRISRSLFTDFPETNNVATTPSASNTMIANRRDCFWHSY